MKRPWLVYGLAFIGGIVVFFILLSFFISVLMFLGRAKDLSSPKIGVLKIKGVINTTDDYLRYIREFEKRKDVKAVVVRIDSPGGSVGASQEIFEELKRLRRIKPVVISMGNIATSGAFYISLGGREIFASPGTITGSIGVILQIPDLHKLLKKIGIETEIIKSGAFKDTGSIYRPLTPEEKKYLEKKVKIIHEQFIEAVSKERKIPLSKVKEIADGRIFTGQEALKLGLIDKIGNFWDAVEEAKRLAKIKKFVLIYLPEKKGFLSKLLEDKVSSLTESLSYKPWYVVN